MKKPFTSILRLLTLALACGAGPAAWAQTTYTPVALTGFTHDIIANGAGAVSASTTADIDGAAATGGTGYCLMAQDYVGPTGQVPNTPAYPATTHPALETSGLITSALNSAITYQLASYSANNALRLFGAGATGTLSFATPRTANELYVIGTSGNAASVLTVTVNFADGTSQVFASQTIGDWFATGQTNVVRERLGRVSRGDNSVQYTGSPAGPRFYQLRLTLDAANIAKNITGITFLKPAAAGNTVLLAATAGSTPACAVAPTGLTTAATTTSGGTTTLTTACTSTNIYLSLTGLAVQTGYTFQWQSSLDGTTWTNIAGATSATYTATGQTAATSYRAQVGCAAAGTTLATSAPVQLAQSPFSNCYCTPVSSGTGSDGITNVTLGTLVSNSSATNSSPYYTDYSAAQTAGTLTIPSVFNGGTTTVSVTMGSDSRQYSGVWIDFDHSGTFDTGEFFTLGTNAGASGTSVIPVAIPATALTGQTKMRVRGGNDVVLLNTQSCTAASSASNYGEVEDYLITIVAPTACTGTPPAITVTSSATTACAGGTITLTAAGVAAGTTGLSYQWQSSPAGANTFTSLGAAQAGNTYVVASQAAATDYRVVVTCTASTQSATSNTVAVAQTPFANCYCAVISTGTNEYIKSVTLPGAPGFTNTTGANSTNGYGDFTASTTYTTTLARGATANLSVTVRSNNTGSQGGLWVDYDQNGVFDASEYTLVGNSSLTGADVIFPVALAVPATALAGPTRLRVRWRNGALTAADACTTNTATGCNTGCNWYGETEDYLVTISATPLATTAGAAATRLALFPNPTQAATTLSGAEAGATVQVLDVLGRAVLSVRADATGKATLALPTSLAKGVYVVRAGQQSARLVLE
jgi:hypothetical protein